jgi:hypothetical protein
MKRQGRDVEYTAVRPKERQQTMSAMLTLQTGVRFPKVLTPFFGPSVFVDVFIAQTTTSGTCTNMSARDCTRSAAVPWIRPLVLLSQRRPAFANDGSVHVGFVVDKVET